MLIQGFTVRVLWCLRIPNDNLQGYLKKFATILKDFSKIFARIVDEIDV